MPTPPTISQFRSQRDTALAAALASEARIRSIDTAIAGAQRAGKLELVAQLQAERASTVQSAAASRLASTRYRQDALGGLAQWLQQTPEQIVGACSSAHPFVLLPVRLETKFARSPAGAPELRVRFFPDDISVASAPPPPSDAEVSAGQTYWRARSSARLAPADTALASAYAGAWTALATRSGAYRAGFIVASTRPQNPDAASDNLVFTPPPAPTEPTLPRADVLPDRFVILTYSADPTTHALQPINRVVGAAIPDDLVLAPDPTESGSWMQRDPATGRITYPDTLKWMVDFDSAVAVGMAVRIPLAPPFDTNGFARVIAVGVRGTTPPEQGPAVLEKLLAKHRYGAGCGLLRSGTPTNNTDSARSGWQPASSDAAQLFTIEDNPPDLTPQPGLLGTSDGARIAALFGLSTDFVRRLPNAPATDIAEALAMNRALAAGTIDNYVNDFLKDAVTPATGQKLHAFFTSWVSGRGHYPTLRIGRQPYGIVLTSSWQNWRYPALTPGIPAFVNQDLAPTVYHLIVQHRPHWQMLAQRVPNAGDQAADPFQRLLSILGLLASSTDFISRKAVSDEYIRQRLRFGGAADPAIQQWFGALQTERSQNLNATFFPPAAGPTDPLIAFMVFTGQTDAWKLPIVDRDPVVPLSERDAVGKYDGTQNYLQWLTQASRADLLAERFSEQTAPR